MPTHVYGLRWLCGNFFDQFTCDIVDVKKLNPNRSLGRNKKIS